MKGPHDDVGRGLRAAVLDLHIGVVGDADDRLLVASAAVVVTPVPDRLAAPVVGLELVFAVAAVVDVDVDRRRRARIVDRRRRAPAGWYRPCFSNAQRMTLL